MAVAAPAKSSHKPTPAPMGDTAKAVVSEPDSLFYKISVSKGQTLSWIGLRHLGAWTPKIAAKVVEDNPGLTPDLLAEGQNLRLRRSLDQRAMPPAQQIASASRTAVVTRTMGPVQVVFADGTSRPLAANQFLSVGDRIRTGAGGVAELIIDNQSVLRVRENSQLALVSIQDTAKIQQGHAGTQVSLEMGRLWTKVRKWAGPLVGFEVRLPNAIAGVHGTIFECIVHADSSAEVDVYDGVVGVTGTKKAVEVKVARGELTSISPDGMVGAPTRFAPPQEKETPAEDPAENAQSDLEDDVGQSGLLNTVAHLPTSPNSSKGPPCKIGCTGD
ncbi:MAG TPA: FecR family protein [Fibrobacteria bacterium]|nr:FecR family protein [Fibrobacteria bacterium]